VAPQGAQDVVADQCPSTLSLWVCVVKWTVSRDNLD
jgi:hypothetical protein